MSLAFFVCLVVTSISAVVSLGFSLVAVVATEDQARDMALYAAARSLAFLVLAAVPWLTGSYSWLLAGGWGMVLVQGLDAGIGRRAGDRFRTWGPAATSVVGVVAVIWLMLVGR
jgi:hypothetical protein